MRNIASDGKEYIKGTELRREINIENQADFDYYFKTATAGGPSAAGWASHTVSYPASTTAVVIPKDTRVNISAGEFEISNPIEISARCQIIGESEGFTILKRATASYDIQKFFIDSNIHAALFEDFTFDGQGVALSTWTGGAITINSDFANCTFNCNFKGFTLSGKDGGAVDGWANDSTVKDGGDSYFTNINNCSASSGGAAKGLSNVTIKAKNCTASGDGGAAVNCHTSTITVEDIISTSGSGGAVVSCSNSTITATRCTAGGADGGAASDCASAVITATDCTANTNAGAADVCNNSTIHAINCFSNAGVGACYCNTDTIIYATGCGSYNGDGVARDCSNATITAQSCTSYFGAGVARNCTNGYIFATACETQYYGGVIYNCQKISVNAFQNTAGFTGGIAWGSDYCTLTGINCLAKGEGGGAYRCDTSIMTFTNCDNNGGSAGATVLESSNSTMTVNSCTNSFADSVVYKCTNCKITANDCYSFSGGNISNSIGCNIYASNCDAGFGTTEPSSVEFISNSTITSIDCYGDYGPSRLYKCLVTSTDMNAWQTAAGARLATLCTISAFNCTAIDNTAEGAGVSRATECIITATGCRSYNHGGGVAFATLSTVTANNCTAASDGGGAYNCVNCIASGNWVDNDATIFGDVWSGFTGTASSLVHGITGNLKPPTGTYDGVITSTVNLDVTDSDPT